MGLAPWAWTRFMLGLDKREIAQQKRLMHVQCHRPDYPPGFAYTASLHGEW